ncbi:MAG TPA: xanthine dehydrogenase family protein molybdopterin-binding subunit [Chloroflexota bacterium]|nr:xanthine dehydrogenase family protein molybdopterin-binding subunit [Chloroflexota bacterium]
MAVAPHVPKFIGERVRRREDPRLITGQAIYVDDVHLVGCLHMAILRSPYPNAKISSIDASAARGAPGVVSVVAGAEVKDLCGLLPDPGTVADGRRPRRYPLATDFVRFVGDPVAAIVAESREAARDALELVQVEYDPRPAAVELEAAALKGAPKVYEEYEDNVAYVHHYHGGDVEQAFKDADQVVSARIVNQRVVPLPMEPRCIAAEYRGSPGELTVWASSQMPHQLRTHLAKVLEIPENLVRVITPEVGGGFGAKAEVYPEEVLAPAFAVKLGRPVRWTADRRDDMAAMIHGRDQIDYVDLAVKRDGLVLGMKLRVIADLGSYFQLNTAGVPTLTGLMASGPYKFPNLTVETVGVLTNKAPTAAYRGAGRPEATFLLERMMDIVAHDLKLDPADVRRTNLLTPDQFPYKTPTDCVYDSGNYLPTLEKALQLADYTGFRKEQAHLRAQGRLVGIGLSSYVEICGMGPSKPGMGMDMGGLGWEQATVQVERTGKVTVLAGISPHGQGQETTFSQIIADRLGVSLDDIQVVHGDTAKVPYGVGTYGSRGTAVGGGALVMSIDRVSDKVKKIAAHLLEAAPDDIVLQNGKWSVKGVPERGLTMVSVAEAAYDPRQLPNGMEPGLSAQSFFEPSNFTYPHGVHVCMVEIDPGTARVTILRYVAVDDCGTIISPMLVHGQVHGGIAQGAAQALMEEVVYDNETGQLMTGSLMDYAVPVAEDLPNFELDHTVTPTPVNPLGAKGVGEAGTIGSTPAVANAVVDALGVRHADMPFRPERVWKVLREKKQ